MNELSQGLTGVYFIQVSSGPIKIGVSASPEVRLSDLATAHYKPLKLLHIIWCETRTEAFAIETAFHRWYKERQLLNEWFDIELMELVDDLNFLSRISNSTLRFSWEESPEKLRREGQRQSEVKLIRNGRATEILEQWLQSHPEDVDTDPRELARKLNVGRSSAYAVVKKMKESK